MIKKLVFTAAAFSTLLFSQAAFCGGFEAETAKKIGFALKEEFSPEKVSVSVYSKGEKAWAECMGAVVSGIRIERLEIEADLKDMPERPELMTNKDILAHIAQARGKIRLLEADVNGYFNSKENTSGFSNLKFDFSKDGFVADGDFKAEFSKIPLNLDLKAAGRLALKEDGVYIEDAEISSGGIKQPSLITSLIIDSINPLLSFRKLPFPIEFKNLKMSESDVVLDGSPRKSRGGKQWNWRK